jgi:SAM-dependent methyltransferase
VLCGIDVSSGMIAQYNAVAQKQGLSQQEMHAVQGDLLAESSDVASSLEDNDEFFGFDIAVVCMGLHHAKNAPKLVEKLAQRLRAGGVLVIVDGLSPSESGCEVDVQKVEQHPAAPTIKYHGFTRAQVFNMLERAGLLNADLQLHPQRSRLPPELGGEQQLFFVRATKPNSQQVRS